jgi:hypothetical protein
MKHSLPSLFLLAALALCAPGAVRASGFEIGIGANYWYSLDDAVDKSFDDEGLGYMISSRIMFTDYLGIGLELERSPDNFIALEEEMYAPAAYAILGDWIYLGLGIGTYYYDGDFYDDTWYALRAGFKFHLGPNLVLDINANYRMDKWKDMGTVKDDIDTDNVIAGAALRLAF